MGKLAVLVLFASVLAAQYAPPSGGGSGSPGGSTTQIQYNNSGSFAGAAGIVTADGSSLSVTGSLTSGVGSGVAGQDVILQGTLPASFPTNSFTLYGPTSIPTAYQWRLPTADAAGAIVSDGAGTPGALSIVGFSGTGNIARVTSPTFVTPVLGAATATSVTAPTLTASTQFIATLAARMAFVTGSTQCLHVDTSGNVSGTGSDCGSGGGGGATTQLDNLSAVSINSALLAQTGIDIGSTTKPFQNLYLSGAGTFGTNYLKLTGTPTSTRTVTFPDATDTVSELGQAQTFTALQTFRTNAVGTTIGVSGLNILNSTAATNVAPQNSGCLMFSGQFWSGSASQQADFCQELFALNGISYLQMYGRQNGGSWSSRIMAIGSDGSLVTGGSVIFGGNAATTVGSGFDADFFQDRSGTKSYWDTTVANFGWMNENRVVGNANIGIRAKASQTADLLDFLAAGGTTVLTSVDVTGVIKAAGYKSSDGTAGATVTTCTGFKNGLCISGT